MVKSRFAVGDVVKHTLFNYRGVVVSVDACFMQTDSWYKAMAKSLPPKDKPWYHVIVDGGDHVTYVAERNLRLAQDQQQIEHPMLGVYFDRYDGTRYLSKNRQ